MGYHINDVAFTYDEAEMGRSWFFVTTDTFYFLSKNWQITVHVLYFDIQVNNPLSL